MAASCVGLDIGSSSIKAVELKVGRRGAKLLSFGIERLPPEAIVEGAMMDQGAVVEAIVRLKDALGLRNKQVATAVAGHSVIVKKIALPPLRRQELAEQIPMEAEHHIPFKQDEVEIDYQIVSPSNAQGQMEVVLVAAKKETIADYTQVIREAKLQPLVMDVAAFSVQNAFEAGYGPAATEATVALIHVGHAITHVNVVLKGSSLFTRDVTVGGGAFTEEIRRRLHVSHDEAEALKLVATDEAAEKRSLPPAVGAVLEEVADTTAAKVQRTLDFFLASSPESAPTKIILSGGATKIGPLVRAVERRAHIPVEILNPFLATEIDAAKFDLDFVKAHASEAAVAVGLALRRPGDAPA